MTTLTAKQQFDLFGQQPDEEELAQYYQVMAKEELKERIDLTARKIYSLATTVATQGIRANIEIAEGSYLAALVLEAAREKTFRELALEDVTFRIGN